MKIYKVFFILVTIIVGNILTLPPIFADNYPNKPIEVMLPWPAGGRSDVAARIFAPYLEKYLGVPVVVTNNVGGGGVVGMVQLRDSVPDGYKISFGGQAMSNFQYMKPGNLSLWDFTWIGRDHFTPMVLAVKANSQFKTVKDIIEYARKNPKKIKHGNTATGSTTHLCSAEFEKKFNIEFTQVPYPGEGPLTKGIGSGEVDIAFGLMLPFRPMIENKNITIIGVSSEKRNDLYPEIPTFKEQGIDFVSTTWDAMMAPKGIPENVFKKLSDACRQTFSDAELIEKMGQLGLNISYQPASEFTKWLEEYDKNLKSLIYELNLQLKK
jgi:tripartite-type tricarboxylate transporter receptor subunit TctC